MREREIRMCVCEYIMYTFVSTYIMYVCVCVCVYVCVKTCVNNYVCVNAYMRSKIPHIPLYHLGISGKYCGRAIVT